MAKQFSNSAFLTALWDLLYNNLGTTYKIYQTAPEGTKFPYITLGECFDNDDEGLRDKTNDASEVNGEIKIWSKQGTEEITGIADAIAPYLPSLTLTGFNIIKRSQGLRIQQDPDGKTWQGIIEIELRLDQTA